MDFRIRCLKCGRMVMLPRPKFEKSVKALVKSAIPEATTVQNSSQ
jgi:DNA-directed RNA polymerase subunit N (RpoN/RPB10)